MIFLACGLGIFRGIIGIKIQISTAIQVKTIAKMKSDNKQKMKLGLL